MKVLLICGSDQPVSAGAADKAAAFFTAQGIACDTVFVQPETKGCTGCGKCWKKRSCVIDDEVNRAAEMLKDAEGLMVVSPVYYGEPDRCVLNFMERLMHCGADLCAFKPAVPVFSLRGTSAAKAQARMNEYFAYADMTVITHKNGYALKREDDILVPAQRLALLVRVLHAGNGCAEPEYIRELDYVR